MSRRLPHLPHEYIAAKSVELADLCVVCRRPETHANHRDPNIDPVPPMPTPGEARDAGIHQAMTAPSNRADKDAVRAAVVRWIADHPDAEYLSANDIRPLLPDSINTAVVGGVIGAFGRTYLEFADFIESTDVGTHKKRINKWRITARARQYAMGAAA